MAAFQLRRNEPRSFYFFFFFLPFRARVFTGDFLFFLPAAEGAAGWWYRRLLRADRPLSRFRA